jgi:hypothetical protein
MYWFSRVFGILVVLALLVPSWAQDAKDKPAKDKKEAVKDKKKSDPKVKAKEDSEPEEKVSYAGTAIGKLKQMDANSQKDFTLTVYGKEPDPGQQQNLFNQQQSLARLQFQLQTTRDRNTFISLQMQIAQTLSQIAQTKSKLFRTKEFDYELRAADNVKVRSNNPPVEYDDKGNLKRWTSKELKALKGHSKLPGYPAEYDALRPGQGIQVYLAKSLANKGPKGLKTEDPPETKRPEVVMILILQEAPMPPR